MIKKSFNRLLSCFLAIALVVGFVPISQAHAHEHESEGVATPSAVVNTSGTSFPVYTLKKNVDDDQAMVLLIMGDGYTASEQEEFLGYAKQRAEALLRIEPFRKYANNINIYAMCVESAQSGVSGVESYLGVENLSFKWSAPTDGIDASYPDRANRLKKEVEDNILTSSSDYKPTVSAAHIIVNSGNVSEKEQITPKRSNGFTFSEESSTYEDTGCCKYFEGSTFVFQVAGQIGNLGSEKWTEPDGNNHDSSSACTKETVKWNKLVGFGAVGVCDTYRGFYTPWDNLCLMATSQWYRYLYIDYYEKKDKGWTYDALCDVCKLEIANSIINCNNVRETKDIYIAYPEITTDHTDATLAPGTYDDDYKIKNYQISGSKWTSNLGSKGNGQTIEFRTIVQNQNLSKARKIKLLLQTFNADGSVKQEKTETFDISAATSSDSSMTIKNRNSCQSLSVKLTLSSDYSDDARQAILGQVIEVGDDGTETVLATDKDYWKALTNYSVNLKYVDKTTGNEIANTGGVAMTLPGQTSYTVTYPSAVGGYTYDSLEGTNVKDGILTTGGIKVGSSESSGTITYYFKKVEQTACEHTTKQWVEKKKATCTAEGQEVNTCADCGMEFETKVLPKTDHTPVKDESTASDSTCKTHGKEADTICSVCKTTITKGAEKELADHSFTEIAEVPATCTTPGKTLTKTCSVCGLTEGGEEIAATGHNYVDGQCTRCHEAEPVEECKHANTEDKTIKAATCTEEGSGGTWCNDCNTWTKTWVIQKIDHDLETIKGEVATCTKDGYSDYKKCKVCGLEEGKSTIEKLGHDYKDGACTRCGAKDPSIVKPTLVNKSNGNVTLDKTDYKVGDTAKVTIKGKAQGNNLQVVKSVKVDGVLIKSQSQLLDKTTWAKVNDVYKNKMGGDPTSVEFENLAVELGKGVTVDVAITESTNIEVEFEELVPVYRLYNSLTSEHLFTTNRAEYDRFVSLSKTDGDAWIGEGINWFAPATGTTVHRLYNAALGAMGRSSHYYTADQTEIANLLTQGWTDDGAENQFMSGGDISIWTCYNEDLGSAHHYTSSETEWRGLSAHGWALEEDKNGTQGVFKALMSAVS